MRVPGRLNHQRMVSILLAMFLISSIAASRAVAAPRVHVAPLDRTGYARIFGIGHNSGRTLAATKQALGHGADIVEIDVRSLNGQLVSSHFPILAIGESSSFNGPTVEQVWVASTDAEAIQLDLKESSDAFVQDVIAFLREHAGEIQVMVTSPDIATLTRLAGVSPNAVRFLSVRDQAAVIHLLADTSTCRSFEGVSIREDLLDATWIHRMHAAGLLVFAWTVNDRRRADELVRLGVDGITTDNLALLEQLGGAQRGERRLILDDPPSMAACTP